MLTYWAKSRVLLDPLWLVKSIAISPILVNANYLIQS